MSSESRKRKHASRGGRQDAFGNTVPSTLVGALHPSARKTGRREDTRPRLQQRSFCCLLTWYCSSSCMPSTSLYTLLPPVSICQGGHFATTRRPMGVAGRRNKGRFPPTEARKKKQESPPDRRMPPRRRRHQAVGGRGEEGAHGGRGEWGGNNGCRAGAGALVPLVRAIKNVRFVYMYMNVLANIHRETYARGARGDGSPPHRPARQDRRWCFFK